MFEREMIDMVIEKQDHLKESEKMATTYHSSSIFTPIVTMIVQVEVTELFKIVIISFFIVIMVVQITRFSFSILLLVCFV